MHTGKKHFRAIMFVSAVSLAAFFVPVVGAEKKAAVADDPLSAFVWMKDVDTSSVSIPTVVEIAVDESAGDQEAVIFEETTKTFQPSLLKRSVQHDNASFVVSALGSDARQISDNDVATFVEFPVSGDQGASADLHVVSQKPFAATGFSVTLDRYVALPKTVEVRAVVNGSERVVLASSVMTDRSIRFPKTSSAEWSIRFGYVQPLRIAELSFFEEGNVRMNGAGIRFLARPGERYVIYSQPDRPARVSYGERPNLSDDRDVVRLSAGNKRTNPLYAPSDADSDGVADLSDNCVSSANADQKDENRNGRGDVCDDYDKDGVANSADNCQSYPNANQRDTDDDKIGDACDSEESRITEKYSWLPWVGILLGASVVAFLFVSTIRRAKKQ